MFFRLKRSPSGRVLQLLESYRNLQAQPRQRVVVSLGQAPLAQRDWKPVARAVAARLYGQSELLPGELSPQARQWVDSITRRVAREGRWLPLRAPSARECAGADSLDGVIIDQITHSQSAQLGPVLLGYHAWKALRLSQALGALGFNPTQQALAAASVINRLVEPVSEHALASWLPTTALPELLGERILKGDPNRFYYVSAALLARQKELEAGLRAEQARHFHYPRTILLYDLTNTHFEGTAVLNPKAKRGHNKQGRDDCPQVVVGVVYDEQGFELAHRTFAGNRSDSASLVAMVQTLQGAAGYPQEASLWPALPVLVIVDAGVATAKNLKLLAQAHFHYLVNDSRRGRQKWRAEFAQEERFEVIPGRGRRSPVKVRVLAVDGGQQVILCKSQGRREKEWAIRSGAEQKFLTGVAKLDARLQKGQLNDPLKVYRALGRVLSRGARVQRFYLVGLKDPQNPRAGLTWQRKDQVYQQDEALLGCYVLRIDHDAGLSPARTWELYMTLTRAEDGFGALKGELGLRPNFHQLEGRVDAHIFISVLAYQLWRFITYTLEQLGDHRDWATLRRVLQTHCYATVTLPTRHGQVFHVRRAGTPEGCHREIYEKFGINVNELPSKKMTATMKGPATL